MTALEKYARLEGSGLWVAAPGEQRRDVVVSFGKATLVISDGRSQRVLSHWSLPAVTRLNPGRRPARYSPDGDPGEVLEIEDDWLIEALRDLQTALSPRRSLAARLRRPVLVALSLAMLLGGALIVPRALVDHTAAVVPMPRRVDFAETVRHELIRGGAQACHSPYGDPAIAALQRALFQTPARLTVMRDLPSDAPRVQHVMGRLFIVDARLLDRADSPEALAGAILIAAQRSAEEDPLRPLLRHAGTVATFQLLTSGELPDRATRGYAAAIYTAPLARPDSEELLDRFARVELSTRPLADNPEPLDPAVETLGETLRTRDPMAGEPVGTALLSDGQWVSLLNICDG